MFGETKRIVALAALLALSGSADAVAHEYRFGALEITHPAVMVPSGQSDCSCAHVKITNHGTETEYFLGADIAVAERTHLIEVSANGHDLTTPDRVAIAPGATLDLTHRGGWCMFMSGIKASLAADMGVIPGKLRFAHQGEVAVEFMIDGP